MPVRYFTTIDNALVDIKRNTIKALAKKFNKLHVETLLDQCSELINRCLSDRAEWEALVVSRFNTEIEIEEFEKMWGIYQKELEERYYELDGNIADKNLQSLIKELVNIDDNVGRLSQYMETWLSDTIVNKIMQIKKHIGADSNLPILQKTADEGKWFDTSAPELNIPTTHKFHVVGKLSAMLAEHEMKQKKHEVEDQLKTITDSKYPIDLKREAAELKKQYEEKTREYNKLKMYVKRDIVDKKKEVLLIEDGPLSYVYKMGLVLKRFGNDFAEILSRVETAKQGLKELFTYVDNSILDEPVGDNPYNGTFDAYVLWIRKARNYLARYEDLDQSFILTKSLKEMIDAKLISNKLFSFDITQDDFDKMCNVRLRGASATLLLEHDLFKISSPICKVILHPPSKGITIDLETQNKLEIIQDFLPPCHLGRVVKRSEFHGSDIVGVKSLYNACPIGKWYIEFKEDLGEIELEDIYLEFHVVMRSSLKK